MRLISKIELEQNFSNHPSLNFMHSVNYIPIYDENKHSNSIIGNPINKVLDIKPLASLLIKVCH